MTLLLVVAMAVTLASALAVVVFWGNTICRGNTPVSFFTFMAILFTSGLDVGLLMFPLVDFELYAEDATYGFANPLAIEFGFWGFLVWGLYFLSTVYFCLLEPRLRLFELPLIRWVNAFVVLATCAFTAYLFFSYLPDYISGISDFWRYTLVVLAIVAAVVSSTKIQFVKVLSIASVVMFGMLLVGLWWQSGMLLAGMVSSLSLLADYFQNIHRFVFPLSDYHAFYLFWWFAWSIMIGQFVSRFVGGLKAWQLLLSLLVVPSIPIAVWFSVLYFYFDSALAIAPIAYALMVSVGVVFLINSVDSLVRLYTEAVGLTVERFGVGRYIVLNVLLLVGLVLLYQFTPMQIQWIGVVVIAIYGVVYLLVIQKRRAWSGAIGKPGW